MDLKDFVKETIVQITDGVKEAQDICKDKGAFINPMLDVKVCNGESFHHDDKDYPITKIKFHVGLTESSSGGSKNGIGVFLGKVSLGHESDKGEESTAVTSIEFSIAAVLPYIDRHGKHVPLDGVFTH